MSYYYECHVTIDPVFDDRREEASVIAKKYKFKLAHLIMKKKSNEEEKVSDRDTFMTGHSENYFDILERMIDLVKDLKENCFGVRRYKIEDVILDSNKFDYHGLLT